MAELPTRARVTGGLRVVATADLRKLHRLLCLITGLQVVDLVMAVWRVHHG